MHTTVEYQLNTPYLAYLNSRTHMHTHSHAHTHTHTYSHSYEHRTRIHTYLVLQHYTYTIATRPFLTRMDRHVDPECTQKLNTPYLTCSNSRTHMHTHSHAHTHTPTCSHSYEHRTRTHTYLVLQQTCTRSAHALLLTRMDRSKTAEELSLALSGVVGTKGDGDLQCHWPCGVKADHPLDLIRVADSWNSRIAVMTL